MQESIGTIQKENSNTNEDKNEQKKDTKKETCNQKTTKNSKNPIISSALKM